MDKALAGSLCDTNDNDWTKSNGKFPIPDKNGVCPSKCKIDGPMAIVVTNNPAILKAIFRPSTNVGGLSVIVVVVMACFNPSTMSTLAMVNNDSAPPCNQSVSANEYPYTDFEIIPDGMVLMTKIKMNWKPKLAKEDIRLARNDKKYKNNKYGNKDA